MNSIRERLLRYNEKLFFGKWKLDGTPEQALLGKGSYGAVYAVYNGKEGNLREQAAIKIIPIDEGNPQISKISGRDAKQKNLDKMLEDVKKEISASEQLKGARNVAYFHDYEIIERTDTDLKGWDVLICMHRLVALDKYFQTNGITPGAARYRVEVLRLWKDISIALSDCEKKGIIHADVKPDNILFSPDYKSYMLCDFGVAIFGKTFANDWRGTFPYMSPEMFFQRGGDNRTDMYSLAVTVYQMLANGHPPLQHYVRDGNKTGDLLRQPVPPIKDLPADVNEALLRCLQEEPGRRLANMEELERVTSKLFYKYEETGKVASNAFRGKTDQLLKKKKWVMPAVAGGAVILLIAFISLFSGKRSAPETAQAPVQTEQTEDLPTPEATAEPTPEPTAEPTPVPVLALRLDEKEIVAETGEVTIHGNVDIDGQVDAEDLRLSVNGYGVQTQWSADDTGYGFSASLDMDLEGLDELDIAVASVDGLGLETVGQTLPVITPEPVPKPTETVIVPIVLDDLDMLDGSWIGPEGVLSLSGTAQAGASVNVMVNGTIIGSYAVEDDGSFAVDILSVSMEEGDNDISVCYPQTVTGGTDYETGFVSRFDSAAPEIDAPQVIDQFTQQIPVSISDQDTGCSVALLLNGETAAEAVTRDGTALLTGIDGLGLTEGSVLSIVVRDSAGNTADRTVRFIRQKEAITVYGLESIESKTYGQGVVIDLAGTADPGAELTISSGEYVVFAETDEDGAFSSELDISNLSQGVNEVMIQYAPEAEGETYADEDTAAISFSLIYDGAAPEIELSRSIALPGDTLEVRAPDEDAAWTVTASAEDSAGVNVFAEDVSVAPGETYVTTLPDVIYDEMAPYYTISVSDAAGNTTSQTVMAAVPIVVGNREELEGRSWGANEELTANVALRPDGFIDVTANGQTVAQNMAVNGGQLSLDGLLAQGNNQVQLHYSQDSGYAADVIERTGTEFAVYIDTEPPAAELPVSVVTRDTDEITVRVSNEERSYSVSLLVDGAAAIEVEGTGSETVLRGLRGVDMRSAASIAVQVSDGINEPTILPVAFENTSEMVEAYALSENRDLGDAVPGGDVALQAWIVCDSWDMDEGHVLLRLSGSAGSVDSPVYTQWREKIDDPDQYDSLVAQAAENGVKVDTSYTNSLYSLTGMAVPADCQGGEQTVEIVFSTDNGTTAYPIGTITINAQTGQSVEAYVNQEMGYAIGFDEPVQGSFRADEIVLTGWIYSQRDPQLTSYVVSYAGNDFTGNFTKEEFEQVTLYPRAGVGELARGEGFVVDAETEEGAGDALSYGFVLRLDLLNHPENVMMSMADGQYTVQINSSNKTAESWPSAKAEIMIDSTASDVPEAALNGMIEAWAPTDAETPIQPEEQTEG